MQAVEVEFTAYAPVTDNTVTLCPDYDSVLVFECLVRGDNHITWTLPPLLINSEGSLDFTQDPVTMRGDITFIIIDQNTTPTEKISQLQVPTGVIIELGNDAGDHLTVSCLASNLTETMTIRISGNFITGYDPITYGTQGSVLSPTLFLLVLDPILIELSKRSCGPSVCGLYLGAFSHADDLRTLSTNISDCKLQMSLVSEYVSSQGLALNVEKCEASISPSLPVNTTHIQSGDLMFPLTTSAKCLGAWWSPNLSCTKWVEENIKKARRVFFARGSGVFHGSLNPLSSKSIVEHCVFPCLLFGAESWILNSTLLQKLESFQAELAKRILRLPTHTSNNNARMALQWPSMRARILIIKLCFLLKVVNSDHSLSARVFRSLAASDVESLLITRQCRFLESTFKSNFTTTALTSSETISKHSLKKDIFQLDLSLLFADASTHPSQQYVHAVATSHDGSWPKLWDSLTCIYISLNRWYS